MLAEDPAYALSRIRGSAEAGFTACIVYLKYVNVMHMHIPGKMLFFLKKYCNVHHMLFYYMNEHRIRSLRGFLTN